MHENSYNHNIHQLVWIFWDAAIYGYNTIASSVEEEKVAKEGGPSNWLTRRYLVVLYNLFKLNLMGHPLKPGKATA